MRYPFLVALALALAACSDTAVPTNTVDDVFGAYSLSPPIDSAGVVTSGHLILSRGRLYVLVTNEIRGDSVATTLERGGYRFTESSSGYALTFFPSGILDHPLTGALDGGVVRFTRDGRDYTFERMD